MEIAVVLVGLAAAIWAVVLVPRHDVVMGTMVFLMATSLLPPEYASIEVGVSITADRIWLVVLAIQFAYDLWTGRSTLRRWSQADLFLAMFLAWIVLRTASTPMGQELKGQPSTVMHLINGYLVPAFLYFLLRSTQLTPAMVRRGMVLLVVFGIYLSITAILEITKQWNWVVPSFIGDPKLGIHFGRARGPMLNSIRVGMCVCASLAAIWTFLVWQRPRKTSTWILTLGLTPLFLVGIALTYTRSIWMAVIAILIVLVLTMLQGKVRLAVVVALGLSAALAVLIAGQNLVAFKREYSANETLESTRMRGVFAYVSWKMFQDRPLIGHGFNQFQVYNRVYLDDRTTDLRLESIRGYVHHNSYLSLLVDLGIIGVVLFGLTAWAMLRGLWMLMRDRGSTPMAKSIAVFSMCLIASHAIQMAFHEVSFTSIEYALLLFGLGLSQACLSETAPIPDPAPVPREPYSWTQAPSV